MALAGLADVLRDGATPRTASFPEIWQPFRYALVATLILSLLFRIRARRPPPRTSPPSSLADRLEARSGDTALGVAVVEIVGAIASVDRVPLLGALLPSRSSLGLIVWVLVAVAAGRAVLGCPRRRLGADIDQHAGFGHAGPARVVVVACLATISLLSALQDVPWLINGADDHAWPRQAASWAAAVSALGIHGSARGARRSMRMAVTGGAGAGLHLLVISLLACSWQAAAQVPLTHAAQASQPVTTPAPPSPTVLVGSPYVEPSADVPPDAVATLVAASVLVLLVNLSEALRKRNLGSVADLLIRRQSQWLAIVASVALAARALGLLGLENETVRRLSHTLPSSGTSGAVDRPGWLDPIAMSVLVLLAAELAVMATQSAWRALGSGTEHRRAGWPRLEATVVWCIAYGLVMVARAAVRPVS